MIKKRHFVSLLRIVQQKVAKVLLYINTLFHSLLDKKRLLA